MLLGDKGVIMKILLRKPLLGWLLFFTFLFSGCIQAYNKPGWGRVHSLPVPSEAYRLGSPEWSPDGQSIVFISREFVHPAEYVDLIVYDLAANETITLSENNDFAPMEVHWSPDQSLIAGDFDGLTWIDTISGDIIREFETGFVYAVGWSPSGSFFTITWSDELNNIALTDYGANGSENNQGFSCGDPAIERQLCRRFNFTELHFCLDLVQAPTA